jgi:hypothetical protein
MYYMILVALVNFDLLQVVAKNGGYLNLQPKILYLNE